MVKQYESEDECYEDEDNFAEEDSPKKKPFSRKPYKKKRPLDDTKRRKAKRALKRSFED